MNVRQYAGRIKFLPPTVEKPWVYFWKRGCFIDCRGPLAIHKTARFGICVKIITQSHNIESGKFQTIPYGVMVEKNAWVASFSILTGCHIGAGSIVAAGTVVRGQTVAPGVMVAGNPARVIARFVNGQWVYDDYNRILE